MPSGENIFLSPVDVGVIELMRNGFTCQTFEGDIHIQDPNTKMGVRIPKDAEITPQEHFNGMVTVIGWRSKDMAPEKVYVYKGCFLEDEQYEAELDRIRREATAEEIQLFLQKHDLLMIDEKAMKDLDGSEVPIHRLSFYKRSTYKESSAPTALYDTGVLYQNIIDWEFDYPIWDKRGQTYYEDA